MRRLETGKRAVKYLQFVLCLLVFVSLNSRDVTAEVVELKPVNVHAMDVNLLAVSKQLKNNKIVRSQFRQEKKIQVLKRPLLSSGRFLFSDVDGLYWQIEKPLYSAVIVTDNAVFEKRDGKTVVIAEAKKQPMLNGFGTIFKSLFSGDMDSLSKVFDLQFSGDVSAWTLVLKPKPSILSKVFKEITLSGGAYVDAIFLDEVNGDYTELSFVDVDTGSRPLSKQEQQYFER